MNDRLWAAYDQMAGVFQQHATNSAYNAHYDRPAVLSALGPVAGLHVLDAACGPGLYTSELLARGAQVTAFDASAAMVELAKAQAAASHGTAAHASDQVQVGGNAETGQGDQADRHAGAGRRVQIDRAVLGEPLPYPDGAFDRVVCALAIHYAADRSAAFAEFYRILRPGGVAVISTQHPFMDWLRKGGSYFETKLETDVWRTAAGEQPVLFWREPLSALCVAATGAGFLIQQIIEPQPAPSMRDRFPDDYQRLTTEPGFIILRLIKSEPGTSTRSTPGAFGSDTANL